MSIPTEVVNPATLDNWTPKVGYVVTAPHRHGVRWRVVARDVEGRTATVISLRNASVIATYPFEDLWPIMGDLPGTGRSFFTHPATVRAERVRRYLVVRSGMSGLDRQSISALGDPDGGIVELVRDDLVALVRAVLGKDAVVTDPAREAEARRIATETAAALAAIPDILAREAAGARADETPED